MRLKPMLTSSEKFLFILVCTVSGYATFITFSRMVKVVQRGSGRLEFDAWPSRLWNGLTALFNQGNILKQRFVTSLFHYFVAWGFIYYALVNLVDILEGFIPGFRFLGHGPAGGVYRLLADVLSVAVLVGILYFVWRRFAVRSTELAYRHNVKLYPGAAAGIPKDSLIVAGFIFLHVGFRFVGASFLAAAEGGDVWQPFAGLLSNLWLGLSLNVLMVGWHISWWLALGLILAFVPWFPYTKHAHLFVGPFNFATRSRQASMGVLAPLNFDDETIEQFGATFLTNLSQTQIIDAFACIMCNRCQDVCPAYQTGKELSPATLEINKRYYIRQNMTALAHGDDEAQPLLEFAMSNSAMWACTSCSACIEVCPVGNAPMLDIMEMRRGEVLMNNSFPSQLRAAFTGIERTANPWQMADDRLAWAASLDFLVPTVEENPDFEVLYWVGCAGAFDPSAQPVAQAIATILHKANVNFAILGNSETCTGDVARRTGNEYLFSEMAQMNIETLNGVGAQQKIIVTGCPHCMHTLGHEYADFGGHYTVMHHTQFIADLIGRGQLKLSSTAVQTATFHDPCYLGRYHGEYNAPRQLAVDSGTTLIEMARTKNNSFCCGAGGGQMWKEEESGTEAVNAARFTEVQTTGADTLLVSCPFCARMLDDARAEAQSSISIKDVAQLIAEQL
jgi:Fe-S oxidoreductase